MAAGSRTEAMSILRSLYRELRPSVNDPQKHVYQTQLWRYIVGLCRACKNQPSSSLREDVQRNLEQTGRSYVLYLQGTREYFRISDEYKGAGERTADDTAKLLGFKMPNEPRDPPKQNTSKEDGQFSQPVANSSVKTQSSSRQMTQTASTCQGGCTTSPHLSPGKPSYEMT